MFFEAFVGSGIALLLVLLVLKKYTVPSAIEVPTALIAAALVAWIIGRQAITLGDETWYDSAPWLQIILFFIMMAGMAARMLSIAIENRRIALAALSREERNSRKVSLEFDRWELMYPMLFSIPTFGALLSQIDKRELSLTVVVLAFQTGFFWQTVLKRQTDQA